MPTCPSGHDSASTDFCDVCGMRMDGSAAPASSSGVPSPDVAAAPAAVPGEPCPQCGAARTGQFCEVCGFNFASGPAPVAAASGSPGPAPDALASGPAAVDAPAPGGDGQADTGSGAVPGAGPRPGPGYGDSAAGPGSAGPGAEADATAGRAGVTGSAAGSGAEAAAGWTAVVTADRAYYDSVIAEGGPDAASIEFPGYCPERRFRLAGREMRVGRRSVSRGLEPEIDLTGPPADPGVSHLHAVLIAEPDGTWAVLDPGSANGTIVNSGEIVSGVRVPLHDGDRICVGAWTVLTMQAPAAS
ncbi:MAG TPA: FHA domain-containing protein [Streptosporangiaceae bacterium]